MSREEILLIVRGRARTQAKTAGECFIMGRRLSEFTPTEQVDVLLWALDKEQERNAEYRQTIDMLLQSLKTTANSGPGS